MFDCWRVLEYAKMRTVLQSKLLVTNKEYGIDPVFTDTAEMKRGKGLLPVLISKRHPKLTSFEPELYLRSFTH